MASSVEGRESQVHSGSSPNIVLIYADDLGYGDLGCFGGEPSVTPHLDSLAREGMRFTDFYVSQAVCSASRAALLTGCYSNRVGVLGALGPNAKVGLAIEEDTIADVLSRRGYRSAVFGKWHLGDAPKFSPLSQGFVRYFGLPYSNDMWPFHPTSKAFPDLPLREGNEVVDPSVTAHEQKLLTKRYTEEALKFIETNRQGPFFVYLPHSMPHVPIFVSDEFDGKTGRGLYADTLAEIDSSVGAILAKLDELELANNTLVLFASDNGPWLSYGNHAGSAGPLREGKGTTWEGGMRVPCLARWPGHVPPSTTCSAITSTIDLLPTIAHLADAPLPEKKIDGRNISEFLLGQKSQWEEPRSYFFYWDQELQGVRHGDWKLHFPHSYRTLAGKEGGRDGTPAAYQQKKTELELYNLKEDIGEKENLVEMHGDVVKQLQEIAQRMREDLGDSLTGVTGANRRPIGKLTP